MPLGLKLLCACLQNSGTEVTPEFPNLSLTGDVKDFSITSEWTCHGLAVLTLP